ncbi:MAG: NrdH-redoxin [Neobacillus sp.]|jgi:glutaredoxin|nr:NrdH-redoxin [Neobacillus sp.]
MREVIVYSQEGCRPCTEVKLWLKENGIDFEERNIRENPTYLNEIVDLGASATPATVINDDNGKEVILGFDLDRFEEVLGN